MNLLHMLFGKRTKKWFVIVCRIKNKKAYGVDLVTMEDGVPITHDFMEKYGPFDTREEATLLKQKMEKNDV